jgi:prepilin-type N-terminal cleavage/methylation domain-containing protein
MLKRKIKQGFTLAEVLITLGIIGVVAAMTIPTLMTNNQQRSMDTAANVFNRKLGEALKVMNSQSSLAGFTTTRAFVDELSKHIKIIKTCDSNELDICFASEFSTNDNTFKVEELKQAKNLNKDGNYGTETIGAVFADGVTALIAYNPNATQDPFSNQVVNVTSSGAGKDLSIGLSTNALAILYDVSGTGNPNTYGADSNGKLKDIRGLNVSIKVGADILNLGTSYSAVDCSDANAGSSDYTTYCGTPSGLTNDYWAGAKKACDQQGMKLPTADELKALYNDATWADKPTAWFWSSSERSANLAYYVKFDTGYRDDNGKNIIQYHVLCISN